MPSKCLEMRHCADREMKRVAIEQGVERTGSVRLGVPQQDNVVRTSRGRAEQRISPRLSGVWYLRTEMSLTSSLRLRLIAAVTLSSMSACSSSNGSDVASTSNSGPNGGAGAGGSSAGAAGGAGASAGTGAAAGSTSVGGAAGAAGATAGSGGSQSGAGGVSTTGGSSGSAGSGGSTVGGSGGGSGAAGVAGASPGGAGGVAGAGGGAGQGTGTVACPPADDEPPVVCYHGGGPLPAGCGTGMQGGNLVCYVPGAGMAPPSPCLASDDPALLPLVATSCESVTMLMGDPTCRMAAEWSMPAAAVPSCCYSAMAESMCIARPFYVAGALRRSTLRRSGAWVA
jgi:hypothetical protein